MTGQDGPLVVHQDRHRPPPFTQGRRNLGDLLGDRSGRSGRRRSTRQSAAAPPYPQAKGSQSPRYPPRQFRGDKKVDPGTVARTPGPDFEASRPLRIGSGHGARCTDSLRMWRAPNRRNLRNLFHSPRRAQCTDICGFGVHQTGEPAKPIRPARLRPTGCRSRARSAGHRRCGPRAAESTVRADDG